MTDLVLFYADLGRDYTPLIERMTSSAHKVMPHARRVLITPTPKPEFEPMFDKIVDISAYVTTTDASICYDRVSSIVGWQSQSRVNTIYVDPDLEFIRPVPDQWDYDVGLLWRKRKPDQPVNTGMIFAKPGCHEFWRRYGAIVANLPLSLRGWWSDQLGFSVLLGVMHQAGDVFQAYDAKVKLLDMTKTCAPTDKIDGDVYAIHNKGQRKWTSNHTDLESCATTSSEGFASLTAIAPE